MRIRVAFDDELWVNSQESRYVGIPSPMATIKRVARRQMGGLNFNPQGLVTEYRDPALHQTVYTFEVVPAADQWVNGWIR